MVSISNYLLRFVVLEKSSVSYATRHENFQEKVQVFRARTKTLFPYHKIKFDCDTDLGEEKLQETDTQVIEVQSSNPNLVEDWKRRLPDDVDIISALIKPDGSDAADGGLGIALEGSALSIIFFVIIIKGERFPVLVAQREEFLGGKQKIVGSIHMLT